MPEIQIEMRMIDINARTNKLAEVVACCGELVRSVQKWEMVSSHIPTYIAV